MLPLLVDSGRVNMDLKYYTCRFTVLLKSPVLYGMMCKNNLDGGVTMIL